MEKQNQIWIIKQKLTKKLTQKKKKYEKNTHYTNWSVVGCGGRRRVTSWGWEAKGCRKHCQMVRTEALWMFGELMRCERSTSWSVANDEWNITIGANGELQHRDRHQQWVEVSWLAPTATWQARSMVTAEIRWSGCEL